MGNSTHYSQHVFLWSMAAIYMFAFTSLYFQIPGLYGRNGILPAVTQLKPEASCVDDHAKCGHWSTTGECERNPTYMLENCKKSCKVCKLGMQMTLKEKFRSKLTLLWLSPYLGLNTETGMELICIIGTVLSFSVLVFRKLRNKFVFLALWVLYFSLYQVGQTFLWFQWDILLLESGFLTIFVAPFIVFTPFVASPDFLFWLVRWLLFRLMLQSGVVKLTSGCPTWWGLTALNWHYESQCIPTPLAWYAHQLPDWIHRLSVVATYVIEMVLPFLFFAPIRSLRIFSFYSQVSLMLLIMLTGNYNFFNLLTIALNISLLDDQYIVQHTPKFLRKTFQLKEEEEGVSVEESEKSSTLNTSWFRRYLKSCRITNCFCFVGTWGTLIVITIATVKLFNLKLENGVVLSEIGFSKAEFFQSITTVTRMSIGIGALALSLQVLFTFYKTLTASRGIVGKLVQVVKCGWLTYIAVWLFGMSLVPFTDIDRTTKQNLWPLVHRWHEKADTYQITNSYGLFRSMTGVGGRPELVIEGSYNVDGGWKEYHFLYKPGNVSERLTVCAPHQPRLDWQMWFAALGSYQHNPWFIHLIYKLLHGQHEVLNLLHGNPFPGKPPTYIRTRLYKYHYTKVSRKTSGFMDGLMRTRKIQKWWKRELSSEYTNPLTKDNPSLVQYIQDLGWDVDDLEEMERALHDPPSGILYKKLCLLRKIAVAVNPTVLMFQLFLIPILHYIILAIYRSSRM